MTLRQVKTGNHECRNAAATYRYTHAYLFSPDKELCYLFFDPKQLLRVSYILWCYFSKCYSIILQNINLWCSIVVYLSKHIFYGIALNSMDKMYKIAFLNANSSVTCMSKQVMRWWHHIYTVHGYWYLRNYIIHFCTRKVLCVFLSLLVEIYVT